MISLEEIDKTIIELEAKDTSYAVIERLAWLYTVRDHMTGTAKTVNASGSEFCEACNNMPVDKVVSVLNEHMECIKVLYPKEYALLLRKIQE